MSRDGRSSLRGYGGSRGSGVQPQRLRGSGGSSLRGSGSVRVGTCTLTLRIPFHWSRSDTPNVQIVLLTLIVCTHLFT